MNAKTNRTTKSKLTTEQLQQVNGLNQSVYLHKATVALYDLADEGTPQHDWLAELRGSLYQEVQADLTELHVSSPEQQTRWEAEEVNGQHEDEVMATAATWLAHLDQEAKPPTD